MTDLLGPGAFGAARAAAVRPTLTPGNGAGDPDTWAQDCTSPTENNGTENRAGLFNMIIAQLRRVIRKSGVVADNTDDDMLTRSIRSQRLNYVASVGGTANDLTITLDPAPLSLAELIGVPLRIKVASTNTGAMTVNVNALGSLPIVYNADGTALQRAEARAGEIAVISYDGAVWRLAPSAVRLLGGRKNTLINPSWTVNQRSFAGGALAAGIYGYDRWKGGSGGATVSASGGAATISAGTLVQVVEAPGYVRGNMTLSWTGTAQARINGGAYAASPITVNIATNANVTIEFGTGTVSLPQFEPGLFATAFESREFSDEVNLCRRYCEVVLHAQRFTAQAGNEVLTQTIPLVPKPTAPTITVASAGGLTNVTAAVGVGVTPYSMTLQIQSTAAGVCEVSSRALIATSEL